MAAEAAAEGDGAGSPSSGGPRELSDIRLGDVVLMLDAYPKYLRAMSLSLRSVYDAKTAYVPEYTRLRQELSPEASVFSKFVIPLAMEVAQQLIRQVLEHYLEESFDVWSRRIDDTARGVKEFKILFLCLAEFCEHLRKDSEKLFEVVKAVRGALVQETMKFNREAGILSIRSYIKDDAFISLLFVPEVDVYAAAMVHGGEKHDFTKPVVAKDQFERALAAACTVDETLLPSLEKFEQLSRDLHQFFHDFLEHLEVDLRASSKPPPPPKKRDPWADFGKTKEQIQEERQREEEEEAANAPVPMDPEEQRKMEELRRRHFEIFKPKAHWMKRSCREVFKASGNIVTDMEDIPMPAPRDYFQTWLETRKNAAGEDIIDVARAATKNVEIMAALDPD